MAPTCYGHSRDVAKPTTTEISKMMDKEKIEANMDVMGEDELFRLQRQYRLMELGRKGYLESSSMLLKRHGLVLRILTDEHTNLLNDLNVAASTGKKRKELEQEMKIKEMVGEQTRSVETVRVMKERLKELDYQIVKVHKDVLELKRKHSVFEPPLERERRAQASLMKLENKLEACVKKFCMVLAKNKELREEIDHLLIERALFNRQWEKLLNQLISSKHSMMDLIEQTTIAYDQREEWTHKLDALRRRAQADLHAHTEEMRDMKRHLDRNEDLRQFLTEKGKRRIPKDVIQKQMDIREKNKLEMKKKYDEYIKILTDIQSFMREEDVQTIVSKYLRQEEENFALFKYVNELNMELEVLSDNIQELRANIDEQQRLYKVRADRQDMKLEVARKELQEVTAEADGEQEKVNDLNKELEFMLHGIGNFFQALQCERAPILDLLGQCLDPKNTEEKCKEIVSPSAKLGNHYITIHNVNIYLGCIESKLMDILKSAYAADHSVSEESTEAIAIDN